MNQETLYYESPNMQVYFNFRYPYTDLRAVDPADPGGAKV